ncbi:MAG TPA: hypothetical protein VFE58_18305 [Tepidisphaeraceae bacterium]|nr:hypothetical protein [Tepidisphaeraceae bacterium]
MVTGAAKGVGHFIRRGGEVGIGKDFEFIAVVILQDGEQKSADDVVIKIG